MSTAPSIVLAGGGTAGHINPLLAIAREIRALAPEAHLLTVGTEQGMEAKLIPAAGYPIAFIPRVPFPRRPDAAALKFPFAFYAATKQAASILRQAKADVVVGVGGYVCPPFYWAARQLHIPIVIHEANAKPGWANKWGARKAAMVGTAFPATPIAQGRHVGMPMRHNIETLDRHAQAQQARQRLCLEEGLATLVVTGGSLGAVSLNQTVAAIYNRLEEWGFQLLHITGRGKALHDEQGQLLAAPHYRQVEFITGMEDVYAAADLMVVRAGAATVSEVAAVGLPAIFVPLPIGNGEQELNARSLVDTGAGLLIKDAEFSSDWFVANIPHLMADSARLAEMAQKSYAHGIRDAAHVMAQEVLKAVR
ncbi:MAG: undecaprenyldiphospho-muramoylpentapeptide beta-N-acetylglucosaminyltransferase [Rothia sp. (in: high G+C Gram-positive bacteria)]|nr:undecaprenyldiphospho-muramoylpentapeptide beta-N-acetylglucosaminyltransferase [Rothia sp. (in: high G+C Gram-positive bacteria)]